jgi:hypothetical protein
MAGSPVLDEVLRSGVLRSGVLRSDGVQCCNPCSDTRDAWPMLLMLCFPLSLLPACLNLLEPLGFVRRNKWNYRGAQLEVKHFFCDAAKILAILNKSNKISNLPSFTECRAISRREHEPV